MKDLDVADAPLDEQVRALQGALATNRFVVAILQRVPRLGLADWYLGAGAVTGTVWNVLHGFDSTSGIKDYDLVYFDPNDLSADGEAATEQRIREVMEEVPVELDVTNEARVHIWYPQRFGRTIPPYRSAEHAISTWPTTASSIGVRLEGDSLVVCAPFGLRDLFAMVVRPNKAIIDAHVYDDKASRWADHWPRLRVLPW
jgi:hypothetical protein